MAKAEPTEENLKRLQASSQCELVVLERLTSVRLNKETDTEEHECISFEAECK